MDAKTRAICFVPKYLILQLSHRDWLWRGIPYNSVIKLWWRGRTEHKKKIKENIIIQQGVDSQQWTSEITQQ